MSENDTEDRQAAFSAADIAALSHLYRGELYRSTVWRTRLDTTTNWAVLTTGIALSLTFSSETASPFRWCRICGPSSPFSSGPTLFLAPSPIAWQARHLLNEVLPAAASCACAPDAAAIAVTTTSAPRGSGTSLSGGALPLADGVLLAWASSKRNREIDFDNRAVVTSPASPISRSARPSPMPASISRPIPRRRSPARSADHSHPAFPGFDLRRSCRCMRAA